MQRGDSFLCPPTRDEGRRSGRAAVLAAFALLVGCSFSSDPPAGFLCAEPPQTCPDGFDCVDGVCVDIATVTPDGRVDAPEGLDAQVTDASATDPDADICTEATTAPNTDDCSAASVDVTDQARAGGVTMYGDTTTYVNDLGSPAADSACLGYITAGADAFYRVDAVAGETITAHVYGAAWDTALYLSGGCTTGVTCYTAADNLTTSGEQIAYTVQTTGTFYVVVDTAGTGNGCYAIDIRIQ